jgi:hypothetical protein
MAERALAAVIQEADAVGVSMRSIDCLGPCCEIKSKVSGVS